MSSDELVGLAEVAETLGVPKRTALRYTRRDDFPVPIGRLRAGPVWRLVDVAQWRAATLPLRPGRPRKKDGQHD